MELLPRAFDSEFWREVREKECFRSIREELFALWEKNCTQPITALTYSEFRMFKYTGNRSVYENNYCTRRRGLCASGLLALIYPEEEKYIERLMDTVYAICDEYTW